MQNCSISLKLSKLPCRHPRHVGNNTRKRLHSLMHNFSLFLYKSVHRNRTPANLLDDFRKQRWQFVCATSCEPAQEHSCTFNTAGAPWQGNQRLTQARISLARTALIQQDVFKVITSDITLLLHTFSCSWSTAPTGAIYKKEREYHTILSFYSFLIFRVIQQWRIIK